MFDTPTVLVDTDTLLAVAPPAAHETSTAVCAYLPAGRYTEAATGAADVFAAMLRLAEPLDATADDFTVTCASDAPDAVARLAGALRRISAFSPVDPAAVEWFTTARQLTVEETRARARSRPWLAEAVLRQWMYRGDAYFAKPATRRATEVAELTPYTFARYVTAATAKRLVLAMCGPVRPEAEHELAALAAAWPGTDRARPAGPSATGYEPRSFGTEPAAGTTVVTLATPMVPRDHPDYRVGALCGMVLSAGDGPLMRRLRHENGHLYRIEAKAVARVGSGDFLVRAEVRPGTAQSFAEATVGRLRAPVDPDYLDALKIRLATRIRHALSTNAGRAADVVSGHFHGLPTDHHQRIEPGIRAVTPERVAAFAGSLADVSRVVI